MKSLFHKPKVRKLVDQLAAQALALEHARHTASRQERSAMRDALADLEAQLLALGVNEEQIHGLYEDLLVITDQTFPVTRQPKGAAHWLHELDRHRAAGQEEAFLKALRHLSWEPNRPALYDHAEIAHLRALQWARLGCYTPALALSQFAADKNPAELRYRSLLLGLGLDSGAASPEDVVSAVIAVMEDQGIRDHDAFLTATVGHRALEVLGELHDGAMQTDRARAMCTALIARLERQPIDVQPTPALKSALFVAALLLGGFSEVENALRVTHLLCSLYPNDLSLRFFRALQWLASERDNKLEHALTDLEASVHDGAQAFADRRAYVGAELVTLAVRVQLGRPLRSTQRRFRKVELEQLRLPAAERMQLAPLMTLVRQLAFGPALDRAEPATVIPLAILRQEEVALLPKAA